MIDIKSLKKRYEDIYGIEVCAVEVMGSIEKELDIKLPNDFKEIASFYSGGLVGGISHYDIAVSEGTSTMVQETLRIRKAAGVNNNFVVLAEPSGSLIVMNVSGVPGVLWCDANDAENINF